MKTVQVAKGRRCPCGKMVYGYNRKLKRPQEYCHGHDQLGKKHPYVKCGKDNPSYKGASSETTRYFMKTVKPEPDRCDGCGVLKSEIEFKPHGKTKSKLEFCNVSKINDSRNPDHWKWLCYQCRFPRAAKVGKVSDRLCGNPSCGKFTLYGWDGEPNEYCRGGCNSKGKDRPSQLKDGMRYNPKHRHRVFA